ncbi:MAG: metal-dependent transcriptional regulator [Propionibacteriaceae bacterium]|jgi:DtxR family Mn-dependent transcriptional regulator|nr:metal-dependent transcriptional regulator [Propionibacteriaceae bacterium]
MSAVIDTTEMYLRTIYELAEEGLTPLRARIAERMQHSGPTVSQTVSRMERDNLLTVHEDRRILLSERGAKLATQVMRRHRLAERLLVDVIGISWVEAHEEACKLEHSIGDTVEAKLVGLLKDPATSVYGTPIPRLSDPVDESIGRFRERGEPLATVLKDGPTRVKLVCIGEFLQRDLACLEALEQAGLLPGVELEAMCDPTCLTLSAAEECRLDADWATQLFVTRA